MADHNFSKLSIIPDAVLVQQIPEDVIQVEAEPEKAVGSKTNGWFSGQVFYTLNPVERIHSIATLGLQAVGIMRQSMNAEHERIIKNLNSYEEIRKVCSSNDSLKKALQESLTVPIDLLKATFSTLSLKDKPFKIAESATNAELESYKDVLHVFDPDMESLQRKDQLSKYPKFKHFLDTHCTLRTYSFHVYKCENLECEYHSCIKGQPIESFGDPVPFTDQEGVEHYKEGQDEEEKFLPSRLIDPTKRSHNIPFSPTAQTALNVGVSIPCTECRKPRLIYAKQRLRDDEKSALKRHLNNFGFLCGTSRDGYQRKGVGLWRIDQGVFVLLVLKLPTTRVKFSKLYVSIVVAPVLFFCQVIYNIPSVQRVNGKESTFVNGKKLCNAI